MKSFVETRSIHAPVDRVWQVMTEVDRWHEWTPSITRITRQEASPLGLGSRVVVKQPKLLPAPLTVTAFAPNQSFTWEGKSPGLHTIAHHRVEATGDGCKATLVLEFHGLLSGLVARLAGDLVARYVRWEAEGLKARSENPSFSIPPSKPRLP